MSADPRLQRENPAVAAKCASEVAQYLYEKRKPTEPIQANATQVIVNGNSPNGEDPSVQRIQVRSFTPVPALTDEREEDEELRDRFAKGTHQAPQMYEENEE
jgi:hypothetical protein